MTDTTIASAEFNNFANDVGNEITGSLPRSGSAGMTGPLSMNNNAITGLANGVKPQDAVTVSQASAGLIWSIAERTSTLTITSNNSLFADTQMFFLAQAGTTYRFKIVAFFSTSNGGYQFGVLGPAVPSVINLGYIVAPSGSDAELFGGCGTAFGSLDFENPGAAYAAHVQINGILQNGANTGNVSFAWAQKTSDPSGTTLEAGSYIEFSAL